MAPQLSFHALTRSDAGSIDTLQGYLNVISPQKMDILNELESMAASASADVLGQGNKDIDEEMVLQWQRLFGYTGI